MNTCVSTSESRDMPGWRQRIAAEYREMPGLMLTIDQAARLWCLDHDLAELLLEQLRDAYVLTRTKDGSYRLT